MNEVELRKKIVDAVAQLSVLYERLSMLDKANYYDDVMTTGDEQDPDDKLRIIYEKFKDDKND